MAACSPLLPRSCTASLVVHNWVLLIGARVTSPPGISSSHFRAGTDILHVGHRQPRTHRSVWCGSMFCLAKWCNLSAQASFCHTIMPSVLFRQGIFYICNLIAWHRKSLVTLDLHVLAIKKVAKWARLPCFYGLQCKAIFLLNSNPMLDVFYSERVWWETCLFLSGTNRKICQTRIKVQAGKAEL